jgi:hypothetical protein
MMYKTNKNIYRFLICRATIINRLMSKFVSNNHGQIRIQEKG